MTDPFSVLETQLDQGLRLRPPAATTDPFLTLPSQVVPAPRMVTAGRYRLPNRDGSAHKGGWTRATNLASSISDTKALGDWECRMVLLGVREALRGHALYHPDVLPESVKALVTMPIDDMEPGKIRAALMELVGQFKALAKAELGAERGNLAHRMVEHHHAGIPQAGDMPEETLDKLPSYVSRLPLHKLEALPGMQERQVMVESLNACGTLDNILRDLLMQQTFHTSRNFIADLKTQKRFWSWLEIACQLALYAHGDAMWDPIKGVWVDMPPVNQERALVAWMPWEHPSGHPEVDIYEVDIVRGWEALQVAHTVYGLRASAKAKKDPWGWMRPVPRQGLLEAYAARLRDVSTRSEASAVYAEAVAAEVWGPELEAVAAEILPRLTA